MDCLIPGRLRGPGRNSAARVSRLFPVRFNHSKNGCIDTETMVRRLNFPGTLQTEDREQYLALVEALGGPDHGGTRLWWDTGNNSLD